MKDGENRNGEKKAEENKIGEAGSHRKATAGATRTEGKIRLWPGLKAESVPAMQNKEEKPEPVSIMRNEEEKAASVPAARKEEGKLASVPAARKEEEKSASVPATRKEEEKPASVLATRKEEEKPESVQTMQKEAGKPESVRVMRKEEEKSESVQAIQKEAGKPEPVRAVQKEAGRPKAVRNTKEVRDITAAASARNPERPQERRQRRRQEQRYMVSTRALYTILGILCVALVAAVVMQEYFSRNTYEKGELARLSQETTKQRRKFMTEAGTVSAADGKKGDTAGSGENGKDGTSAEEGTAAGGADDASGMQGTAVSGAEETGASGTAGQDQAGGAKKTVVETSESINLKNQLIGVLPGILPPGETSAELIKRADVMAAMYDYEGAAALLKNCSSYEQDSAMQAAVEEYRRGMAACVEYPIQEITHIFFHTLIKDPERAFDGDQYEAGYNQYMVTIDEFNSIIQQMYDKGYVMVTLQDMAPKTVNEDGSVSVAAGKILLPEGKIPFVLSQDDVSYYHYMDGDGFASRLVIDENGDVKNEYIEADGTVSVGDYDMVPLIDRFVEQHPDFSYRGAKGYVALTGYDGILGYRTDICYKTRENLTSYQAEFFEKNPDFSETDYQRELEQSRKVAEAMKEDGWLFASHTWGHVGLGEGSTTIEQFKTDTDKWEERVKPLIGETDTIIYAFGGDIGGAEDYSGQRFEYLKSKGFDYFCGVDSAVCWVQLRNNYLRQARRNIDGYRMYYNPDMLEDLFDVEKAWDPKRPDSVPPI